MSISERITALADAGVSVWLDDLSRELLRSGDLGRLIDERGVVGITTNPTIFAAALANGAAYDDQVRQLADRDSTVAEAIRQITVADVQHACDLHHDTWMRTEGVDGRVSLEVDPGLARDTDRTLQQARELWKAVDRPNLLVKIPATEAGIPAITGATAEGISVNVTLIFSVERYRAVMAAYLDGLEQADATGRQLASINSVASFFVSRVDAEVDRRLDALGTDEALELKGTAALANARLAHAAFSETFTGDRWASLHAQGARAQRALWASTGTKNPHYPDTRYVTELVAPGTVNTMPRATLEAFADHGELRGDTVTRTAPDAQAVFDGPAAVGVDITALFLTLEDEGIAKFEASWAELADTVQDQLDRAR